MNRIFKQVFTAKPTFSVLALASTLGVVLSTVPAKAETTECIEIASVPITITEQGIYCFKQNLVTAINSGNAIEIANNNVTIDLNGFKLGGNAAGPGTQARGIYAGSRKNVTIKNGNIRGFHRGIYLEGTGAGHLVEGIRADRNTRYGIYVLGENNVIRNNHVINTGGSSVDTSAFGIYVSDANNTLISGNVVSGVSETASVYGIHIQESSNVEVKDNSIYDLNDAANRYGVHFTESTQLAIHGNQIINPAGTGTIGIYDGFNSTGVGCIQNLTVGYNTATSGCNFLSNHLNY